MTLKEKIVLLIDYAKMISSVLQYVRENGTFTHGTTERRTCFSTSAVTHIPMLDCYNAKSLEYLCYSNKNIQKVRLKNTQNVTTMNSAFYDCQALETLGTLDLSSCINFSSAFTRCYNLKNVSVVPNTINRNFNVNQAENLTAESAKSVILGLMNYAGTDAELSYSVTFHSNVWALLDAEGNTAPHGGTWRDYVYTIKGWNY